MQSGPFIQTLTIGGTTVLTRSDYPAVYMYSSQAGWDANLYIGEDVKITSAGPFGAVWLRSESTDQNVSNDLYIDSAATIVSHGANADGITATSNNGQVTLINRGRVTVSSGRGLYADGGSASLSPVDVRVTSTGHVYSYQAGIRAVDYNGNVTIDNDGYVRSTTRQGIIGWSADGGVEIDNSGTVVADHYDAIVAAGTGGDVVVTNSGSVTAIRDANLTQVSPDFHAISAYTDGNGSVTISNAASGQLTAAWDAGMSGASSSGQIRLTNAGEIDALTGIRAASQTGTVEIDNSGRIEASETGIIVTHATGASIVNSGTLFSSVTAFDIADGISTDVENSLGGLVIGAMQLGSLSNFENAGTLVLKTNASLASYGDTGSATSSVIGGDFIQTETGRLEMAVDGAASYSTLQIGGTASLAGTLILDLGSAYDGSNITEILRADGGLTDGGLAIVDNSLRYSFRALYDATALDLIVRDTGMTTIRAALDRALPGAAGIGDLWDDLAVAGSDSAEFSAMLRAILQSDNEAEVASTVAETLPLVNGGMMSATFATLDRVNEVVRNRIGAIAGQGDRGISSLTTASIAPNFQTGGSGRFAGDALSVEQHVWLTTFAGTSRRDGATGMAGSASNGHGIVAGIDGTIGPKTDLGLAFAWSGADVSTDSGADQGADANTYQLAMYGRHAIGAETGLFFQVDAGRSFVDGYRVIDSIDATAVSSYATDFAHAGIGLDRTLALGEVTLFKPSIWLDYTWMKDAAYTETGADDLNLIVEGRSRDALVLGVNGLLTHDLSNRLAVSLALGAGYDLLAEGESVQAAYAGSPDDVFTTAGGARSPWQVEAALALTYTSANGFGMTARYDAWRRDDAFGQSAGLELFKRF